MAKVNDLQCVGDALFQGDVKANGKLNNEVLDVDDNCIIIDVCRRLDLSAVDNEINIPIPDGYVADARAYTASIANYSWSTYGSDSSSVWTTNAVVTTSVPRADDPTQIATTTATMSNASFGTASVGVPFFVNYINIKVTTACEGATKPYALVVFTIYCHKES